MEYRYKIPGGTTVSPNNKNAGSNENFVRGFNFRLITFSWNCVDVSKTKFWIFLLRLDSRKVGDISKVMFEIRQNKVE